MITKFEVNQQAVLADNFRKQVIDALVAKHSRSFAGDGKWHMSSCGVEGMEGYCRRRRFLTYHGVKEKISEIQQMIFLRGHLTEIGIKNQLQTAFPKLVRYKPAGRFGITKKVNIKRPDGANGVMELVVNPDLLIDGTVFGEPGVDIVCDAKSINIDARLDGPKLSNYCQINMYVHILRDRAEKLNLNLRYSDKMLLYYERAGREFDIAPYICFYNRDLAEACIAETHEIMTTWPDSPVVKDDAGDTTVLTEMCPPPLIPTKYPCIWSSRSVQMRCGYFELCYPDIVRSTGCEVIENEHLERAAAEWYELSRQIKDLKTVQEKAKRDFETAAGDVKGKQVGKYYIARNGQITIRESAGGGDALDSDTPF